MLQLEVFDQSLTGNLSFRKWSTREFSTFTLSPQSDVPNSVFPPDRMVVASLIVLVWEYVITLTDEVRYIWRCVTAFPASHDFLNPFASRPANGVKASYIFARYFGMLVQA